MLDAMRKQRDSILIYLIFGALIVVFGVNFGPGSTTCSGATGNIAADVNGEPIRAEAFQVMYGRQIEAMRRRFRQGGMGDFTSDMAEQMGLRKQVIDQLVERKLLEQMARDMGLVVSDADLVAYLKENYGVDGVTAEQYQNWVQRSFQTSVARFEEDIRGELMGQKVAQVVTEAVGVSDDELKSDFLREHDRAMITYVKIDPTDVMAPEPGTADLDKLLAEGAKEIEERYNTDVFKYRTPQEHKVRQIVKKVAVGASEAEVARARSELQELKAQLEGGADFVALAKTKSDDAATKDKGGELGFVRRGQLDKTLEDAVFALKANAYTAEPVRTAEGFVLAQVTEVRPPAKRALDEVKRDVALSILRDRAGSTVAKQKAEALLADLKAGKTLEALTISEEDARKAAEAPNAVKPAEKPLVRRETPWILRSQEAIPRLGASPELQQAIFALTLEKPMAEQVFSVGKGYVVVKLAQREAPDMVKFETEKAELRKQALSMKRARVLEGWVDHLRESAKVELNQGLFGGATKEGA